MFTFSFLQICAEMCPVLEECFSSQVELIAEPGRFFVASAFSLAVNVISVAVAGKDRKNNPV